jgi:hypothetical protein
MDLGSKKRGSKEGRALGGERSGEKGKGNWAGIATTGNEKGQSKHRLMVAKGQMAVRQMKRSNSNRGEAEEEKRKND